MLKPNIIIPLVCKLTDSVTEILRCRCDLLFRILSPPPPHPRSPYPCECGNVHTCRNAVLVKYVLWTSEYYHDVKIKLISLFQSTIFLVSLVQGQIVDIPCLPLIDKTFHMDIYYLKDTTIMAYSAVYYLSRKAR